MKRLGMPGTLNVEHAYSIYSSGKTLTEIANQFKCCRHALADAFRYLGLSMRSPRELSNNYWKSEIGRAHAERYSKERKQRPEFSAKHRRLQSSVQGCVYVITNTISGKLYIGQTISPLMKRWGNHRAAARHGQSSPLYSAIRKHGSSNFTIKELFRGESSVLDQAERLIIKLLQTTTPHGYKRSAWWDGQSNNRRRPKDIV